MQSSISKYFQPAVTKSSANTEAVKSESKLEIIDLSSESTKTSKNLSCESQFDLKRSIDFDASRQAKFRKVLLCSSNIEREASTSECVLQNEMGFSTESSPRDKTKLFTPLEKQVLSIRQKFPDSLLMVECGYRMRFFGQDAINASRVLGIYAHIDHSFMIASVPTFRAVIHCRRLLNAGFKVAIVRQTETVALRKGTKAASSSTFDRSVAGVFTSGTVIDDDDPAFDGFGQHSTSRQELEDQSDNENDNENDCHIDDGLCTEFNSSSDNISSTDNDDIWISSVFEEASTHNSCGHISVVSISVKAHLINLQVIPSDEMRQSLCDHIDTLKPSEVILPDCLSSETKKCFENRSLNGGCVKIIKYFPSAIFVPYAELPTPAKHAIAWLDPLAHGIQRAVAGLRVYLIDFGLEATLFKPSVTSNLPDFKGIGNSLIDANTVTFPLDGVTARDLEVFDSLSNANLRTRSVNKFSRNYSRVSNASGGLFGILDNCKSVYGKRTLRSWVMHPLTSVSNIIDRQQTIDWLRPTNCSIDRQSFVSVIFETLNKFPDVEKLLTSLQHLRLSPPRMKALLQLAMRLSNLQFDKSFFSNAPNLLRQWLSAVDFEGIAGVASSLLQNLFTDQASDGDYSITGYLSPAYELSIPKLKELRQAKEKAEDSLSAELCKIRALLQKPQLQYSTLRTGAMSQLEYLIEIPLVNEPRVPKSWTKLSSTKQVVRFHSPEVIVAYEALQRVRDESKFTGQNVWKEFSKEVSDHLYEAMRSAVQILGNFDAILSLVKVSQFPGYCRPSFPSDAKAIEIYGARHPVLERALANDTDSDSYLPNDIVLGYNNSERNCQVITGPNMGGKSSYCRMVALIALMAQIGSYVPAESASLVPFDNILTRMGAEDDLHNGKSTFLCELIRTNAILQLATAKSLLIIDELGRGTSTHDGYAIAQATLEYIVRKIGCATLFITHFPQISNFVDSRQLHPHCVNAHMSYMETVEESGEQKIIFLYKLVEEASKGSYGINVARLAGIPITVTARAVEISQKYLS